MSDTIQLDKMIHEQARLKILVLLASSPEGVLSFTEIRKQLEMTAGNLSIQLKTLEEAGFVELEKRIEGKKPVTDARLTPRGKQALLDYISSLEHLLSHVIE